MEDNLLTISNLEVAFSQSEGEVKVLDKISFEVKKGKIIGIVGESGCGKSVTAMSIIRLLPYPLAKILGGEIFFEGRDILSLSVDEMYNIRGNEIGFIFQEPMTALNPVKKIGSQLCESLFVHQKVNSRKQAINEAIHYLKQVGIPSPEKCINEYPHQLSGGMRQRVVIAIALICKPKLIIADEPTTALDVTVQAQILNLILELREKFGISVIFITHDMGVVSEICDEIVVMYAGRIVERGEINSIFENPRHAYTKALLNSIPKLEMESKTKLNVIPGTVTGAAQFFEGCRFCQRMGREDTGKKPEEIQISEKHWVENCPYCTNIEK